MSKTDTSSPEVSHPHTFFQGTKRQCRSLSPAFSRQILAKTSTRTMAPWPRRLVGKVVIWLLCADMMDLTQDTVSHSNQFLCQFINIVFTCTPSLNQHIRRFFLPGLLSLFLFLSLSSLSLSLSLSTYLSIYLSLSLSLFLSLSLSLSISFSLSISLPISEFLSLRFPHISPSIYLSTYFSHYSGPALHISSPPRPSIQGWPGAQAARTSLFAIRPLSRLYTTCTISTLILFIV